MVKPNENVDKIIKEMMRYGFSFCDEKAGKGYVYTIVGSKEKIYIRGSENMINWSEREPFIEAKYFLFGCVEKDLYRFGHTEELEQYKDSFVVSTKNGCVCAEKVARQIKMELKI